MADLAAMETLGVVCSVLERDAGAAARAIAAAPGGCGAIELRADHLTAEGIRGVVRGAPRPLIVTIRRREEGGGFGGDEGERRRGLEAALEAGARFVDVEWEGSLVDLLRREDCAGRVILSCHGGPCRAGRLHALYRRMAAAWRNGPLKLVPQADRPDELLALPPLLDAARRDGRRLAAFPSGRAGRLGRLLAPAWGSWATYGSAASGRETAEGQFSAAEMLDLYDVMRIGPRTRLFALVGSRLARSPSPAIHAAGYRATGLDARYLPLEADALEPALTFAAGVGLGGLAVTMPFKQEMAERCRPVDDIARRAGAVNTVLLADGRGYNTDGPAALERIRRRLDPRGRRAVVLGAGGTARAFAVALRQAGCEVVLLNRSAERGREAAKRSGASYGPPELLGELAWDLLLHATPQGADGERFVDPSLLRGRLVLDAVYGSRPTALARDARARGLHVIDGTELLAAQGALQFELLTGRSIDHGTLHRAALRWSRGSLP